MARLLDIDVIWTQYEGIEAIQSHNPQCKQQKESVAVTRLTNKRTKIMDEMVLC